MSLNKKSPIVSQAGVFFFTKVTMYSKTIENRKQATAVMCVEGDFNRDACVCVGGLVGVFFPSSIYSETYPKPHPQFALTLPSIIY